MYANPPDQNITNYSGKQVPISSELGQYFEVKELVVSLPQNPDESQNYTAMSIEQFQPVNMHLCTTHGNP
jgi:hypothetical protein